MIRSFVTAFVAIVAVVLFGTSRGVAMASQNTKTPPSSLPFNFTNATPGINLEIFINNGKAGDVPIDANGSGSTVLDISNLGKVQVKVYVDVCEDGKNVKVLVAAGQDPPDDKGCRRRAAGGAWWTDCGVTRLTLDLTKFGLRVVGCGSFWSTPTGKVTTATTILIGGFAITKAGGEDSPTTFSTSNTNTTVTSGPAPANPTNPTTNNPMPTLPDWALSILNSFNHPGGNTSIACIVIVTTPPQAAGTYLVTFSGPGVVSGASASGTLNAAGRAIAQAVINAFGTYGVNVSVTSGGVTRTATASINVVAANSTCPAL